MTTVVQKPKKAYIILSHRYLPKRGVRGEMEVHEDVEFSDRIRNRHITNATAIIDVVNERMESSRNRDTSYEDYVKHVIKKYPDHYKQLLKLLEKELPAELRDKTEKDYDIVQVANSPEEVKDLIVKGFKVISTKKVEGKEDTFTYTLGKMNPVVDGDKDDKKV